MIHVSEARQMIAERCTVRRIDILPLIEATGCVLAEDVCSPLNTPPFDQSAVDGYAFSFALWDRTSELRVTNEIQAGDFFSEEVKAGEAVRIFTGAPVPQGADTVVMQERVTRDENCLQIHDDQLISGSNVRPQGSQTRKGQIALPSGHLLTPASISFLASLGVPAVHVFAAPRVSIIVTGKELIQPGHTLTPGKIFESNSFALRAALQQLHITPSSVEVVDDDVEIILDSISRGLNSDLLILTGGASVGDYDFVPASLEACGVERVFHKVRQKPGKPFYFGTYKQTLVFALPGNPAAVLTCFYTYILPAIRRFTSMRDDVSLILPLANDYMKKAGLTHFLKAKRLQDDTIGILDHQESYLVNSFAYADALVELDEDGEHFSKGDLVRLRMIR